MIAPNRILVTAAGAALSPRLAARRGVTPDIAFVREDKWVLGAPKELEQEAFALWPKEWSHFQRAGDVMRPISQYKPAANGKE